MLINQHVVELHSVTSFPHMSFSCNYAAAIDGGETERSNITFKKNPKETHPDKASDSQISQSSFVEVAGNFFAKAGMQKNSLRTTDSSLHSAAGHFSLGEASAAFSFSSCLMLWMCDCVPSH